MLTRLPLPQSYGPEHLLTFHNLKRVGLLTEQSAGETLTAVESKVSRLVTDRAAGESQPSALCVPGEPRDETCPAGSCCRADSSPSLSPLQLPSLQRL